MQNRRWRLGGLPAVLGLLVLLLASGGCSGSGDGGQDGGTDAGADGGGDGGGDGSEECTYPRATLRVSISPSACTTLYEECMALMVVAESPQITSLISGGNSPCTRTVDSPQGCEVGVNNWTYDFCYDPGECGSKDFPLPDAFGPAVNNPAIGITDTVNFCPVDETGGAQGTCVGSIVDQCNPDGVITLNINAVTPTGPQAEVTIDNATCTFLREREFQNGIEHIYQIVASGTAMSSVEANFWAGSNPVFHGDNELPLNCDAWSEPDQWNCLRSAGEPESTGWTKDYGEYGLFTPTGGTPQDEEIVITGRIQLPNYGDVIADESTTITCEW